MGARIFENTPALEVTYGDTITVRTAKGVVRAQKILWSCGAFLDRMEPYLDKRIVNTYAYQLVTEPLPTSLIEQISPIRGAFSDIRPCD
nr:FAD-dependent oxidoreductase [Pseudomonas fulva]